ncbi:MAG: hypothetical protein VW547_02005 [Alphaproteobacteria bacterium]
MPRRPAPLTSISTWDLPIEGATTPGLTALGFFDTVCKPERDRQRKLIDQAEYRERYVLGSQWESNGNDPIMQEILADEDVRQWLTQENLLSPLCETWAARVDQGRIEPRVAPHDSEVGDVGASEAGNMLLDALRQKNDERSLISEAAMLAQYHGDVLFYPTWNESMVSRVRRQATEQTPLGEFLAFDPMTDQPIMEVVDEQGDVGLEVIAAPSYWDSGEDKEARARWRVVERPIDEDTAKDIIRRARGEDAPDPKTDTATSPAGIDWRGVYAYEVWCKPGTLHPQGFYALIVGGVPCVLREPYPYQHRELPGAVWKVLDIRNSPRGGTHVTRAIHQQRQLNSSVLAILSRVGVAKDVALMGATGLLQAWKAVGKKMIANDSDKELKFVEGPDIPPSLFKARDTWRAALHDTFGISEATMTGGDPTETKSGKQLRDATALDAQKIAGPRARLELAMRRVAKQMLSLAIQHYEMARLVRSTDPSGETRARFLSSADLAGADLLVEIGSGALNTRLAGQRYAEESAQAGYTSPQQAREQRETGLPETVGAGQQRARVHAQIGQALSGRPQQPLPDVEPAQAAQHVRSAISALGSSGANVAPLLDLLAAYEDAARQKAMQPQNGPGKAPQQGGEQPAQKAGATKFRDEAMKAPQIIQ